MAKLINADPKEIVFTSGATESNNISIKGVAKFYKNKKRHIITTQTVSAIKKYHIEQGDLFFYLFRNINVFWNHADLYNKKALM